MNNYNFFLLLTGLILLISCNKEKVVTTEIDEYKWIITIPSGFKKVNEKDWEKVKSKGKEIYENYAGKTVKEDEAENTLFTYKKGKLHTLEANYKIFDKVDDFTKSNEELNIVTYEMLKKELSNTELDSMSSKHIINGLEFESFVINLNYPNGERLTAINFRRLFGEKIFTINILYRNEGIGKELLKSVTNSKFE